MIHEEKCYSISCDECGKTYENDGLVIIGYSPDEILGYSSYEEIDGKHCCFDCALKLPELRFRKILFERQLK